jgi:hypothetical protein
VHALSLLIIMALGPRNKSLATSSPNLLKFNATVACMTPCVLHHGFVPTQAAAFQSWFAVQGLIHTGFHCVDQTPELQKRLRCHLSRGVVYVVQDRLTPQLHIGCHFFLKWLGTMSGTT